MNAIIFLAPVSCFDQVLMEDQSVNRLVSASQRPHLFVINVDVAPTDHRFLFVHLLDTGFGSFAYFDGL